MGDAARKKYLLPLDSSVVGDDSDYVGPTLSSYRYEGSVYAVPVDAACQVAAYRPDLMQRLDTSVPQDWPEVFRLGEFAQRQGLRLAVALSGVHGLMCFFTLMAGFGKPCATTPDEPFFDMATAREALSMLRRLTQFCPPDVLDWNSIRLHDMMVARDVLAYCPAVYCYATYAEADQPHPLRFADQPGKIGSTIGGTGLAVSASCKAPDAARSYAKFAASLSTQREFAHHHGQPARAEIWSDGVIDHKFGGCFAATRATMERSWIRPRYSGYLGFQEQGGSLIEQHLRGSLGETDVLDRLQRAFVASKGSS